MFDQFMSLLAALNANVLWGIPMVVLMIGTGAFLLVVTRGVISGSNGKLNPTGTVTRGQVAKMLYSLY